ncbi:hypothetical protein H5410_028076, partial [Solanum commersonii]
MNHSDSQSEPTISDISHEVSSLKEEIRIIKFRLGKVHRISRRFKATTQPKLINLISAKPFDKETSSSSPTIQKRVLHIMALNREYNNIETLSNLAIPIHILIEHSRDENNPTIIKYSRFTIKKILDHFEWFADHLHTPIALSITYRPQTYN